MDSDELVALVEERITRWRQMPDSPAREAALAELVSLRDAITVEARYKINAAGSYELDDVFTSPEAARMPRLMAA
jgi:hypothetical protein